MYGKMVFHGCETKTYEEREKSDGLVGLMP